MRCQARAWQVPDTLPDTVPDTVSDTGARMALIPPLRVAREAHDVELARALFREYAAWLGVDLCFQGFEDELAALPGKYAPPLGLLLIAGPPGDAVGCAALRPLPSPSPLPQPPEPQPPEPRSIHVPGIPERGSSVVPEVAFSGPVGEVKRLYVQPRARGTGTGRALAQAIVDAARAIGYRTLCLDTLERMTEARALYESLGFSRCARYYDSPLDDAVYYSLDLHAPERPMTP